MSARPQHDPDPPAGAGRGSAERRRRSAGDGGWRRSPTARPRWRSLRRGPVSPPARFRPAPLPGGRRLHGLSAHHTLPAGCGILPHEPEPWTPTDAQIWTKVVAWGMGGNRESELARARLVNHPGAARAATLEPAYPAGRPLTAEPGVAIAGLDFSSEAVRAGAVNELTLRAPE